MIVEVYLEESLGENVAILAAGEYMPVTLQTAELGNLATAIAELALLDSSNKGWIIDSDSALESEAIKLNSASIDAEVSIYDKGGVLGIHNDNAAYNAVSDLVNSVLSRKFIVTGDNIIGWVIIKKIDTTNFLIEVSIVDVLNEVEAVDVIFVDYIGSAPIPTEINLINPVVNGTIKTFSMSTLTFEDPVAAIGGSYDALVDFKNNIGQSLGYVEVTIIAQDI